MKTLQVNDKEFEVIKLLGKGKGGYSYLVTDVKNWYVLKKIHHEPCSYYNFGDKMQAELGDYEKLKKTGISLPELLDADIEREHILKQYIPGDTVYEMVKEGKDVSAYADQVRSMCDKLYKAGLNIDYFPTNFIPENGILYYIDFECNNYMEEWNFENWGIKYWSQTKEFMDYVKEHTK